MIDDNTREGRMYIVFSKKESNRFRMRLYTWDDVEQYIKKEPEVYKIVSVDVHEIPLTGLDKSKPIMHVQV